MILFKLLGAREYLVGYMVWGKWKYLNTRWCFEDLTSFKYQILESVVPNYFLLFYSLRSYVMIKYIALSFILLNANIASKLQGKCPRVTTDQTFNFESFMGRWFIYAELATVRDGIIIVKARLLNKLGIYSTLFHRNFYESQTCTNPDYYQMIYDIVGCLR